MPRDHPYVCLGYKFKMQHTLFYNIIIKDENMEAEDMTQVILSKNISGLGDSGRFKWRWDFPTLTRLAYCQCRLRKVCSLTSCTFIRNCIKQFTMIFHADTMLR